jgi:hypothetical protein
MQVIEAIVFDLLYTLVHPGSYPGGADRVDWLAEILRVDRAALVARWEAFEPELETGRASAERPRAGTYVGEHRRG